MFQKIFTLLIVSVLLVSADIVKQEYSFDAPVVANDVTYLKGCRASTYAFGPKVSVLPSKVLLRVGQQARSVRVEYGNLIEVPGEHYIAPYLPGYSDKSNRRSVRQDMQQYVNNIYDEDVLWPGTASVTRSQDDVVTQFLCGAGICVTMAFPVQYNPVRGKLYYYDKVTVTIETENIRADQEVAAYVGTPFSKSRIYQIVDNKEAVAKLPITPKDGDDYEYLILSAENILGDWDDLVALNTRRGMRTKIQDVSKIPLSGDDLQDRMRKFIKQEYDEHKIVFAVLGGDIASGGNNVPARELYTEFYDHNKTPDRYNEIYPAADMYFGTLDGNWNDNSDSKYGEPGEEDMFWEVFVARMPCDDASDLGNLLHKTQMYSEEPVREDVTNYLGLGEFLWENEGIDVWGAMSVDQYIGKSDANGFTTYGITDNFTVTRLDDRTGGGDASWNASDLAQSFNSSKATWIDHDGHGNAQIAFGISSGDINGVFKNNGTSSNYFVGISGACSPGKFHKTDDCFFEKIVNYANVAVAGISNNEFGYGDDDGSDSPTGRPYRYVHDALFNPDKRVHFLEAMHAMGKEANVDVVTDPGALDKLPYLGIIRYCCYNTNLFGDPALSVWTDTPQDLDAPFTNTFTADKFTMEAPPYTWVAIADESGKIITTQLTGYEASSDNSFDPKDSTCTISDDAYKTFAASNTKAKLIIKAHNYIAATFDVTITSGTENTMTNAIHQYSVKPVTGQILFAFNLPANENVNLSVYNSKGTLVKTVLNEKMLAGNHSVKLSNNELSNGIYYGKLKTQNTQMVRPFILTK